MAEIINFPHSGVVRYDGSHESFEAFLTKVPAHMRDCFANTEMGLTINGQTQIAKGTDIHFENGLIANITRAE